jgi:Flp pilus assembly protein TadG
MKNIKNERGQSLVELSISLVLLLVLLSGAVEFGVAFFQFVQLRDAAQEGALYGSMNPANCTDILARVKGASSSPIDLNAALGAGQATIATTINGNTCGSGAYANLDCEGNGLKVDITFNHQIFMPFLPQIIGTSTIPLRASVTDTILSPVDCTP